MKVIFLKDVPKVGQRYDVKDFSPAYAQNVLIAKGLAVQASPKELDKLAKIKNEMNKKSQEENKNFENLISAIKGKTIVLKLKANEKGHLFSSVTRKDISKAIKDITNLNVEENLIHIQNTIKEIGTHEISIKRGDNSGVIVIIVEKL